VLCSRRACRQWVAVPFAATHKAMAGRDIFSSVQPLTSSLSNSSTAMTPVAKDAISSSNHTGKKSGLDVSWLGTFDPAYSGVWMDSALLLVFGGIPWQVCGIRFLLWRLSTDWGKAQISHMHLYWSEVLIASIQMTKKQIRTRQASKIYATQGTIIHKAAPFPDVA